MTISKKAKRALDTIIEGYGKLRRVIDAARAEHGLTLGELTVLSEQTDPYRLDTPAGHRNGRWAAQWLTRAYKPSTEAHLRGLHYYLMRKGTVRKPDGDIYLNTDEDWIWLSEKALKAARWLGYIPFDRFRDRRNRDPQVYRRPRPNAAAWVHAEIEVDLDGIEPTPQTAAFTPRQPYCFVITGEKSSLESVLLPLAIKYEADLFLDTGEMSDTHLNQVAQDAIDDGRPLIVFTATDCDPAGWQMTVSIIRKLQALKDLRFPTLRFEVVPVALTPKQVSALNLPSTPLKKGEKRADKWREAFGIDQTEIDTLLEPEELEKNALRDLVENAIKAYWDATLEKRVRKAEAEWTKAAQEAVDAHVDADRLADIQADAAMVQQDIQRINEELRDLVDGVELPPIEVPEGKDPAHPRQPLVSLDQDWVSATRALIEHKAYSGDRGDRGKRTRRK